MQYTAYYRSPIGILRLIGLEDCLVSLRIHEGRVTNDSNLPEYMVSALQQLDSYFKGTLRQFDVPVRHHYMPDFTKDVWKALATIPFGQRVSYIDIAKKIGNAKAARAVGSACNRNPLPLIIPCHRVVGSNGALTGFALGVQTKEWLLNYERRVVSKTKAA